MKRILVSTLFLVSNIFSIGKIDEIYNKIKDSKHIKSTIRETGENLLKNITSIHTKVFSRDNLITSQIDKSEWREWQELIENKIKPFIESIDLSGFQRERAIPVFNSIIKTIREISNDLLKKQDYIYLKYVKPALTGKKLDVARFDFKKAEDQLNVAFKGKDSSLVYLGLTQKNLKNFEENQVYNVLLGEKSRSNVTKDEAAKAFYGAEILNRLALTLELTIDKLYRDLEKLKKA